MFGLFKEKAYQDLGSRDFEAKCKEDNGVLLDVRTRGEYSQGYIPGAKLIDISSPGFTEAVDKLDKTKSYYVYCRSGGRSGSACNVMTKMGFEKVHNLSGGIMSWHGPVKR